VTGDVMVVEGVMRYTKRDGVMTWFLVFVGLHFLHKGNPPNPVPFTQLHVLASAFGLCVCVFATTKRRPRTKSAI